MLRRDQYGRKKKPRTPSAGMLANALAQAAQGFGFDREESPVSQYYQDAPMAPMPGPPDGMALPGPMAPMPDSSEYFEDPGPMAPMPQFPQGGGALSGPPLSGPAQPDPLRDGALIAAPTFPSPGGGLVTPQELDDFQQESDFEMPEVSVTAPRDFTPGPHGPPGPREEEGGFMQRVGRWMQPGSPTAMSLLSAGLGILANNTGHYGQAGPAIGKGGLMGVNTFLQLQRQAKQEEVQRAQMAGQAEQREINNRAIRAQTSREERAIAKEVALEALVREMERTPPGPKRDQLERLWAFRSGQGSQYIKATQPGAGKIGKPFVMKMGNDEQGNPIEQNAILMPDNTVQLEGQPTIRPKAPSAVSIDMAGEKKESQDEGARRTKQAGQYFEAADLAGEQKQDIAMLKAMKLQTGRFAPIEQEAGAWKQAVASVFGFDEKGAERLNNAEKLGIAEKIIQGQVFRKQTELKGHTSDSDMKRADKTFAQLKDPKDTFEFLLDMRMAQLELTETRADFFHEWRESHGGTYEGAEREWRKRARSLSLWDSPHMLKWSAIPGGGKPAAEEWSPPPGITR